LGRFFIGKKRLPLAVDEGSGVVLFKIETIAQKKFALFCVLSSKVGARR